MGEAPSGSSLKFGGGGGESTIAINNYRNSRLLSLKNRNTRPPPFATLERRTVMTDSVLVKHTKQNNSGVGHV